MLRSIPALAPAAPDAPADPTFWEGVLRVLADVGYKLLWIVVIIAVCAVISWLLRFVIRRIVRTIVLGAKKSANVDDTRAIDASPLAQVRIVQRTRTLGTILQNITNVTLVIIAIVLIINVLNREILGSLTLISAAVGAGLGFGAQNIVKDVLNGIFIVAEDQIGIGDVVDLGLATGVVEYVSIRITHVRDVNGTLWFVRNGEVTRIGNMSQGWSRVIIDLAVPVDVDLDEIEGALLETARGLQKDPKWRTRVLEKPELWGLESVSGDALVVRLVMKTRANAKDDVARELRVRIKRTVDAMGVRLPALNSITLTGLEGAQRVRGANPPKTRPHPIAPSAPSRPVWKPRRGAAAKDADTSRTAQTPAEPSPPGRDAEEPTP